MPKLYSSSEVEKVLRKRGFEFISQKGSHGKFRHGSGSTVIVPMGKREIPFGTFKSILKQAGISKQEFEQIV